MIIKVHLESYPSCKFSGEGSACSIIDEECYEKAPEGCPLRKGYVIVAAAGKYENIE